MNEQNYTSLELSKKLKDCGLESDEYVMDEKTMIAYDSYDILNDLCVKYAKELFPDYNRDIVPSDGSESSSPNGKLQITRQILLHLQLNEKQEAEDYLWEHCLFNKANN